MNFKRQLIRNKQKFINKQNTLLQSSTQQQYHKIHSTSNFPKQNTQQMSYTGYSSYQQNISDTQEYNLERIIDPQTQYQNPLDQTYEQSSRVFHTDLLCDMTNKIRIADALNSHFEEISKSSKDWQKLNVNLKGVKCGRRKRQDRKQNQNENENQKGRDLSQRSARNARAHSLIYFQQKQQKQQEKQNQSRIKLAQPYKKKPKNQNLPLQHPKTPVQSKITKLALQPKITKPKQNISISKSPQPKYFPKNQPHHNQSTRRQILLTNRSGYTLSVSENFLQNLTKQYNQSVNQLYDITLKQKIQQKISRDKKNRLKTENDLITKRHHQKSVSRLYKPMDHSEAKNSRVILSTQSFSCRQMKTLQNKRNKVEKIMGEKTESELKQCTFRPKTNNRKSVRLIK